MASATAIHIKGNNYSCKNMTDQDQTSQTGNRSLDMCRRTVTTESFIAEAKEIYGDRYDYSKVEYKNRDHRVTIICPVHGEFQVYAREHLDGKGCPKCEKGEKFLAKLHERFGDKFGLEQFVYESSTTPVTLICPTHGPFTKLPNPILASPCGCPECGLQPMREAQAANEAKKRAKQEAAEQARTQQIAELNERINSIKSDIQRWLNNPTLAMEKKLSVVGAAWVLYRRLVDAHIDDIRYGSKLRDEYVRPYLVPEEKARLYPNYADGDMLYRFPGEAPHPLFIESYKKCIFTSFPSIEQELSHRECIIFFKGENLYILEKSYQPQIIPQNKKSSIIILPDSFVSIDFETLYAQRVSACSVGLVKYKDGKQVDHYYSLIRPPFEYEGKKGFALTHIHGFREEDLVSERTMKSILPEIEKFVGGLPLVAHNASVEKGCLRDTIAFYGLRTKLAYENIYDTLYLSKDVEKQLDIYEEGEGTHTLDAVCRRFGVCEQHHHNALDDAEMCGNLILAFKAALKNGHVVQLEYEHHPEPTQKYTETQEETGFFSFFKKIFGISSRRNSYIPQNKKHDPLYMERMEMAKHQAEERGDTEAVQAILEDRYDELITERALKKQAVAPSSKKKTTTMPKISKNAIPALGTLEYDIAGINFRKDIADYVGDFTGYLKPQPTNQHDPKAIAIYANDGHHLGYIPAYETDDVRALGRPFPIPIRGHIDENYDYDESRRYFYGSVCLALK